VHLLVLPFFFFFWQRFFFFLSSPFSPVSPRRARYTARETSVEQEDEWSSEVRFFPLFFFFLPTELSFFPLFSFPNHSPNPGKVKTRVLAGCLRRLRTGEHEGCIADTLRLFLHLSFLFFLSLFLEKILFFLLPIPRCDLLRVMPQNGTEIGGGWRRILSFSSLPFFFLSLPSFFLSLCGDSQNVRRFSRTKKIAKNSRSRPASPSPPFLRAFSPFPLPPPFPPFFPLPPQPSEGKRCQQ